MLEGKPKQPKDKNNTGLLSFGQKTGYAMGDFASNLSWQMIKIFLLYFYTDVYGITPSQGGLIYFISRIWDAANDPVIGYVADHTKSRWGKFRPYILFGAVPLGIINVLTFTTPELGPTGKFIYALVTFLLLCTIFTFVTIPFSTLSAVITEDTNERSSIAGYRMFCAGLGILTVSIATQPLVKLFENEQRGFQAVVILYSIIAAILYFLSFASSREVVTAKKENRYTLKDVFSIISKNRPLLILCAVVFFTGISITLRQSAGMYFIKYNLGKENLFPVYMAVLISGAYIGIVLSTFLSKKIGKRNMYITAIAIYIAGDLGVLFTPYSNIVPIFCFLCVAGIGYGGTAQLMWAMAPDTVEYAEWKTGIRAEGITFSAFSFILKLETAVGGILGGVILSSSGYVANVVQSETSLNAILYMVALAPIVAGIIGIGFLYFYNLDKVTFSRIIEDLKKRRG
ncbi:MFS transporter [Spirochaetota bacterium]